MTDFFSLLEEARRPWLEPDKLKEKFLGLTARLHPDRVHAAGEAEKAAAQERFSALNAAYNRLRDPKERLQHLLELELGHRPQVVQQIPKPLMELALEIGSWCRRADALIEKKRETTSPLLQVAVFQQCAECTEGLLGLQNLVWSRRGTLETELKRLDLEWEHAQAHDNSARAELLSQLEELYRLFSYFGRWGGQLQDRIVQLSF